MNRITSIDFYIPGISSDQERDGKNLIKLLSESNNITSTNEGVIKTNFESGLAPNSTFSMRNNIKSPMLSLVTLDKYKKSWMADNFVFGFNLSIDHDSISKKSVSVADHTQIRPVSSGELFTKLSGNVKELNHTGINFSPDHIGKEEYLLLKKEVSTRSNLYNYPTGEEWPFLIPATEEEFDDDIADESLNRNPKFEIVYSDYNAFPVIQIDIETGLTKRAVFELFPDPYGISYKGLENSFRSVFVDVDWGNTLLRFDIGFRGDGLDFGYWMIKEGGRV